MGTFKKISCIVSAVLLIVVSSIFPAFAEGDPIDIDFIRWGYCSMSSNTTQGLVSTGGYGFINSLPDSNFLVPPARLANNVIPEDYYMTFAGAMADSNGDAVYPQSSYSYHGNFELTFRTQQDTGHGDYWSIPGDLVMHVAEGYNIYNDQIGGYVVDAQNFGLEFLITPSERSVEGAWAYYNLTIEFVFRCPSDYNNDLDYNWLCMEIHQTFDDYNLPLGWYNTVSAFKLLDVEAQYDPTGEIYDDSVSQIIQGQIEAAQYQLDQEREAVQADLDAALDQDTSGLDISNLFGSSLVSLYNSITYTGSTFDFKLPASGTVPLLNTQLWPETSIPIKEYIDKVPSAVWVVVNFLLWFLVIRSIIKLVHKLLDLVNGDSGGDD